jgi:hypothetical protein
VPALTWDPWPRREDTTRSQGLEVCHYGLAQRWLVVQAQAARERVEATVPTARQRDEEAIEQHLFPLPATRCKPPAVAHAALVALAQRWPYHHGASSTLIAPTRYAGTGRPTPPTPLQASAWHSQGRVRPAQEARWHPKPVKACCGLGTHSGARPWSEAAVMAASKSPSWVDGGCRFLQAPLCCVASLLVKKPSRIAGLLMVRPLALVVSSGTQRRMRQPLARRTETVPHHLNQPPASPTFRGVFQRLEGMHRVRVTGQGQGHDLLEGLNDVPSKILRLFGEQVCCLYQIAPG